MTIKSENQKLNKTNPLKLLGIERYRAIVREYILLTTNFKNTSLYFN